MSDSSPITTRRQVEWASTMAGVQRIPKPKSLTDLEDISEQSTVYVAHRDSSFEFGSPVALMRREDKEENEAAILVSGATFASGAGVRARQEEPDAFRTCFERDRDRILHSNSFRRLAGKTQVVVCPLDHQRTRLTHALEVSQIAVAIATALRLNVALTEAIALGHDCGHGPGGHASEDALSPYVEGGYDHAVWGADVHLLPLNLCEQTLDGIRNHSWSRPSPKTPEGEVVSWADRIAYVCHDFEDAVHAEIVDQSRLPETVIDWAGSTKSRQISSFINDLVHTAARTGIIGMSDGALVLAEFRRFNYENIYMRSESIDQARNVIEVLSALTEFYISNPLSIPELAMMGEFEQVEKRAVAYVSGMTDRFAFNKAVELCGWDRTKLPRMSV